MTTDKLLAGILTFEMFVEMNYSCILILFRYRDYPNDVGATFPGKMCTAQYSAGIALVCNYLKIMYLKITQYYSIILYSLHLYLHLETAFVFNNLKI